MKLKLLLAVLLCAVAAPILSAQTQPFAFFSNALAPTGTLANSPVRMVTNATIRVCLEPASGTPCTPLATIYSDPGLSVPLANPFQADFYGNYVFYVPAGTYHVQQSGPQVAVTDIPYIVFGAGGGGGGNITFEHNGVTVGVEPKYNMVDTGTAIWTVTDDPTNTRVNAQIAASGGGGGLPAGVLYDIQINDPLNSFGSDTGVGQINPTTHTITELIASLGQQVNVSDTTHNGQICQGHTTGSAIDSAYCTQPSATFSPTPSGGYGLFPPDNAPAAIGDVATVSSITPTVISTLYGNIPFYPQHFLPASGVGICGGLGSNPGDVCYYNGAAWVIFTGNASGTKNFQETSSGVPQWGGSTGVSLEYEYPVDSTNAPSPTQSADLIRTLFVQQPLTVFGGPDLPTSPLSSVIQDNICTIGDSPTCQNGAAIPACTLVSNTVTCTYTMGAPVTPGDTLYVESTTICGAGCSGNAYSFTNSLGGTYSTLNFSDGSGASSAYQTGVSHPPTGGINTVTVVETGNAATSQKGYFHVVELRGNVTDDGHAAQGTGVTGAPTFQSVTTSNATDTLLASLWVYNDTGCSFSPGTGYTLINSGSGVAHTIPLAFGAAADNVAATNTYTPTLSTSCTGQLGTAITQAFTTNVVGGPAQPWFHPVWLSMLDYPGGPLPNPTSGSVGQAIVVNSANTGYALASAGTVSSVSGTTNQIDVATGTTTPVVSLDGQFTSVNYATCTNTADALTVTLSPAPTSLVNGLTVQCRSSAANTTTTPTLNVNSLGAKTIVKGGSTGQQALVANDILTNMAARFTYNATATTWELQNPQQLAAGSGTVTSVGTSSPLTGGPITTTGTIACATCVVASSPGAGIARFAGSTQTVTSAELSGDATTSGSNAVTVVKVNGAALPASKAFVGTNSSSQIIDATGTLCSSSTFGICKVDGTTITASGGVISAAGGGITSISLPTNIFSNTPCSGPTCTFGFNNQSVGYVVQAQNTSNPSPFVLQAKRCNGTGTVTCTFSGGVTAGSTIYATAGENNNSGGSSGVFTDSTSSTYTVIYSAINFGDYAYGSYALAVTGGTTTVTFTQAHPNPAEVFIYEIANVNNSTPLDVAYTSNSGSCSPVCTLPTSPITTVTANDLIFGHFYSSNDAVFAGLDGWGSSLLQHSNGSNMAGVGVYLLGSTIGTYTPGLQAVSGSPFGISPTVAFRAATTSSGGLVAAPLLYTTVFGSAVPGAAQLPISTTSGDTGIDIHVGTPINANAVTTAYAGNNTASTLYALPSLGTTGAAFDCWVYVSCHTSVSTATVIPALLWTDESGTAETLTGTTATCTTLGTTSASSQAWPVRAESHTTIYLKTTIANSPSYDVHAHCSQSSNQ